MKRKKLTAILLSVLMMFSVMSFTGCNHDDEFSEKPDPNRTQIYVFNYYAGFRADWLVSVKKQFEELYSDYIGRDANGEPNGKVGVQILMDNRKEEFSNALTIRDGNNDVYFTEGTQFHGLYESNAFYDMTEWVTTALSEFGETRSIVDKMSAEQKEYMSDVKSDSKAHYYALPHYNGFSGIVYNKDLFKSRGFYFSESNKNADFYDKFTSDLNDLTAGPDGEEGTYDDGLPATYDEFYELCNYIQSCDVVPFIWNGEHYKAYLNNLFRSLHADYEGAETRLNYTLNGKATRLINADGSRYGAADGTVITSENAYLLARQEGRLKALEFMDKLIDTAGWQTQGTSYDGVLSHTDAQALYLSAGADGEKAIAMLIDGTWWEGEATDAFDDTAKRYNLKPKAERGLGWMPMPKASKNLVGTGRTVLDTTTSLVFVKATLAPEKADIVSKLIRFVNSDKMLSEFTRITSACKAFDYEVTDADKTSMTVFARDVWEHRKGADDIIYTISDAPLIVNNQSMFNDRGLFRTKIGNKTYDLAPEIMHENPQLTAAQVFQGMIDYQAGTWWNTVLGLA